MLDPAAQLPPRFNAAEFFIDRHIAEGRATKVAIICGESQTTYGELAAMVDQAGNALLRLGVRSEERVLLLLLDCPEFAAAFFGAIKIGAVPVPVSTMLKPDEYEYLLNDSGARVVIVSESLIEKITAIPHERVPALEHIITVSVRPAALSRSRSGSDIAHHEFNALIASESSELPPAPTHKDDACFWMYSSGSTGAPKGCVHLQHDMVVTAELYARNVLGITEDDRFFSTAKLFFAYGLGNALYFPLLVGGTSILMSAPARPQDVFEIIERHRPTLLFSVPSSYAAALHFQRPDGGDYDLSSVRYAVSAGESLPAAIYHRFKERFGVEILDAIGSTEALHMFIANRPGAVRPGSSGQLIPGCAARIVDEEGRPVATGEIGNLYIRSDATCAFYWRQHEKSKETFEGPWLRTGDKYSLDADGYYWYAGRSDDMLKVSGVWVSPVEIENVLIEHEAVAEVAVVARRDTDELLKPAAWIVPANGFHAGAELAGALTEFAKSRLPGRKVPRWFEFVDELPKTATGKLQRYKLRNV
ncbi:MAG: benzoate-CoA ligase family protein [Terriglobales bacterium]